MMRIVVLTAITASIIGLAELFFGMSPVYAAGSVVLTEAASVIFG